ncbi:tRNA adenosine(34) deaminase TadA [Halodesulfovibrio marinisediminis]|uniref:tRNA-specific adenosine deaminase n=1 Tax=Halodesulfovibrio marinisediminis DSM 17456 TaxID=1121457 RepID=A0A1N6HZ61_9BACT|nr:tRNA adenosine(34) deaminase TadA [Halodesulfovibrio marinisediminis]SIO24945.1 tRNA-adenosine deaminase [Halodesulfovibrio marinisediminis DSM 17456]
MTTRRELEHCYDALTALPQGWESWDDLMRIAMEEAQKAEAIGEVPVGAVLVAPDGTIVAKDYNKTITSNDPTAHAEILAMRKAGEQLQNYRIEDLVLVVTLEPCLMCSGAMVHARIRGVVYGAPDLKTGALDSQLNSFDLPLHNHAIWHKSGVLQEECSTMLSAFFKKRRKEIKAAKKSQKTQSTS